MEIGFKVEMEAGEERSEDMKGGEEELRRRLGHEGEERGAKIWGEIHR